MHYLLFFIYIICFCWLITKNNFIRKSNISGKWLIGVFLFKLIAGLIYGYIYSKHIADADTWRIYIASVRHTKILISHPFDFFKLWIYDPAYDYKHPFSTNNSYWNDIRDLMMIKVEAILNIFSFSNYYINVLFYTFFTFWGYIAFIRAYGMLFPHANKALLIIAAFFVPSAFFWTSGMHKDGIIFMLISFIVYQSTLWLLAHKPLQNVVFKIAACFFFILLLRNYVAVSLAITLLICILSCKYPKHTGKIMIGILAACIICFFLSSYISPALSLPEWLVKRRIEFNELAANSKLSHNTLNNSFHSYLVNLPEAFNHGFFRPYLWENMGAFYIPFAMEIVTITILVVYYLFNRLPLTTPQQGFLLFGVLFLFINWIFLGYVVHIVGALVRYRSIFLPFFIAPLLLSTKFKHLIKN